MHRKKISKKQLDLLRNKSVAILGYGSQGKAQALNLLDSGILPIMRLPPGSKSRRAAGADVFKVTTP